MTGPDWQPGRTGVTGPDRQPGRTGEPASRHTGCHATCRPSSSARRKASFRLSACRRRPARERPMRPQPVPSPAAPRVCATRPLSPSRHRQRCVGSLRGARRTISATHRSCTARISFGALQGRFRPAIRTSCLQPTLPPRATHPQPRQLVRATPPGRGDRARAEVLCYTTSGCSVNTVPGKDHSVCELTKLNSR